MRRNTSGAPAADPADSSGRAADMMGIPVTCGESAGRESGAAGEPFPANGTVLPIALAADALRTSIGAVSTPRVSIPRDTGLDAGATLAVSCLDVDRVELAASTWRLISPAGAREIDGAGAAGTVAIAAADALEVTP
jgi:hypothetical protein